jgi:hypothetical protein
VIIGAGMTGFSLRLMLGLHARHRARAAKRMMARTLRSSVRHQNAHQTIAVLRQKREVEVQPLETAMVSRADLCQRIESVRQLVVSRKPAETGSRTPAQSLLRAAWNADRPLLSNPG